MVLPSQTKIDLRASPWLVVCCRQDVGQHKPVGGSVVGRWCVVFVVAVYVTYAYAVETAACIARVPARVCRLVMMSKYSCSLYRERVCASYSTGLDRTAVKLSIKCRRPDQGRCSTFFD